MPRVNYNCEITEKAAGAIDSLLSKLDMNKRTLVERTLEWLAAQDEVLQQTILGTLPNSVKHEALRNLLDKYIEEHSPPKSSGRKTAS